jgi:hypothetical protein
MLPGRMSTPLIFMDRLLHAGIGIGAASSR